MSRKVATIIGFLALLITGCAKRYVTPGAGADLRAITSPDIRSAMEAEAAPVFPARIAVARVEGSGYRSYTTASFGTGQFSVVTARDIERDEDFERLARLPRVTAVTSINKLLLPPQFNSARD